MSRLDWDTVWENVAVQVAHRTLCTKARVGAVITDAHNRMIATGYNGPPAGFEHNERPCTEWCGRGSYEGTDPAGAALFACPAVHAEANALLSSERDARIGGTIYINKHPCWECTKLIANSGLARVVLKPLKRSTPEHEQCMDFLEACGLTVEVVL